MLQATDVTVRRGARAVLRQAALQLEAGQVLSLLGANGAGKSTLLAVLAAELQLRNGNSGTVTLNAQPLPGLSAAALARSRMVLPQNPGLAFDLDVHEVVAMGAYPFPELPPQDVAALVARALRAADIVALGARRYLQLSGGEQQRVQFARVLLQALAQREADPHARFLLLDEPTASLDPRHQQALLTTVVELARSERLGVLVILHDVNLAACWSDCIALLADARVVACGAPTAVLTPDNLRQVYGVSVHVMPHPHRADRPLVVFG